MSVSGIVYHLHVSINVGFVNVDCCLVEFFNIECDAVQLG